MAARAKQRNSPERVAELKAAKQYRLRIVKSQPMPWLSSTGMPVRRLQQEHNQRVLDVVIPIARLTDQKDNLPSQDVCMLDGELDEADGDLLEATEALKGTTHRLCHSDQAYTSRKSERDTTVLKG